ncbi:MAG: RNA methyltransferase RsmE [Planctomycetaceae bacterium]|jgi:16S rRNA (uracil1498-N3)-methyltransferase|nr:RsmE family RNA methyltransferase [Planctomycetia bacterium]PHY02449.1 MAG: RNA methyltransferase RsmE [Planctomycetaceae bacterium]
MSERFFIDTLPLGNQAVLKGDEARHLTRVLRAKIGDAVRLFNGRGSEWPAQVVQIGRDTVSLEIGAACVDRPSDSRLLTVAAALPKGDRQKWMVEKLTELGVGRLIPLATTRGVAEATAGAQARLERGVIEACKQCGRNTLMEVAAGHTLDQLLAAIPAGTYGLIAHPGGSPLNTGALRAATAVLALVGPEGGFTDDELVAADRSGLVRVSLGPHILRVETAAISLAAQF